MPKISALNNLVAPALDDFVPIVDVSGNQTNRVTVLNLLNAKSGATITVTADGTGDYPTIQQALDAVPDGGAHVIVQAGSYALTSDLVIKKVGTVLEGEGLNTVLTFSGASIDRAIHFSTTELEGVQVRNLYLVRDNTTGTKTALDFSDTPQAVVENVRADFFDIGLLINDTANLSFYSAYRQLVFFECNTGIQLKGNPVNDNTFDTIRINCKAGGAGKGLDLQNGNGNTFVNLNCEPGTGTGITGISIGASAYSNTFVGAYVENNATGVSIASGATNICFFGGEITGNTSDVSDSGTSTKFIGVALTSGSLNQYGSMTTTDITSQLNGSTSATAVFKGTLNTTDSTQNGLHIRNLTNFAHSGDFILVQIANGSDTGRGVRIVNNGTGSSISSNNGTNDTFTLAKNGLIYVRDQTAPGSNPSNGGYLYVESGALKYRGSGGTVTTIANA